MASNFMSSERVVAAALVLVGCVLCLQHAADAAPPSPYGFLPPVHKAPTLFADDNACYHDTKLESLCQHCAKSTKSNLVYPMCCGDEEDAREWCVKYLEFGQGIPAAS